LTNTVPVASMVADVSMLTSAFALTFSEAGYGQAVADRCRSYSHIACDALDCGGGDRCNASAVVLDRVYS
jgi:hypothetical protein